MSESTEILRDEKGRPIADDGYPKGGLAKVTELPAPTGLALSTLYAMIQNGHLPSKAFGRSRRVEWAVVRKMFLDSEEV